MSISRRAFGLSVTSMAVGGMVGAGLVAASAVPAMAFDLDDLPNVFIAPMGKPFRAKDDAPYPVVDWFKAADKNGDGKLDHAEFMADAGAFFDYLDLNHDGKLSSFEVEVYERRVAPEILGQKVVVGDLRGEYSAPGHDGARLWRAQFGTPLGDVPVYEGSADKPPSAEDPIPEGAALFSLLNVPEPLAAADVNFSGVIKKADFLKVADRRFNTLDRHQDGFLILAKLPKTFAQVRLERQHRKGFHL